MTLAEIIKMKQVIIACQPVSIEQLALEWIAAFAHTGSWPDGKQLEVSLQLSRGADKEIKIQGSGSKIAD